MYIQIQWTDEIGDLEEKEFWSWNECLDFVIQKRFKEVLEEQNESNKN